MKLSTRITLATSVLAALVFGGAGLIGLRFEEHDLQRAAEREATLLGRSLQVAIENAVRDRQIEDVTETLQALATVDPSVSIFVFDEAGVLVGASTQTRPQPGALRVMRQVQRDDRSRIELARDADGRVLRLGIPIRKEMPSGISSLIFEKPLTELERDLSATRLVVILTTLGFIITVAGAAWILTRRTVSLPLARLIEDMHRVRSGHLDVQSVDKASDEVGATRATFEQLVTDLNAARARAAMETEARLRMEHALQEADKLITLGQLSAIMAHEIGSPLQVLEGRARALKKHATDPQLVSMTADMLVEQTGRITRIVGQMLSMTRRRLPRRSEVDLEALIQSVAALLELEARRKEVSITVRSSTDRMLSADGDQIQQVVLNLLRNALDAAPKGSSVEVSLAGDEQEIVMTVVDTGPGIPAELRAHLFEPFFTTKAEGKGSGLGLSVVRSIVREHRGTVEFVDDALSGCRARVVLPRREAS